MLILGARARAASWLSPDAPVVLDDAECWLAEFTGGARDFLETDKGTIVLRPPSRAANRE